MTNLKTSLLVNRQVPEFVREEHPKFILFLEAYYEFLDQNGYGKAKQLKNISDVDVSLDEFEQQFYNSFLPFIPRNSALSKDILIKNILPLYLSKGSEKSYRLLFRMLFNDEIKVETPGKRVLRASDGKWVQENIVRVGTNVYSEYISDGIKNTYYLPYIFDKNGFQVYVNDQLTENYEFRKETRKIIFNNVPNKNQIIKVEYFNFNSSILNSLKIVGKTSGASAIIERASRTSSGGLNFYQFFINNKNFLNDFIRSEIVTCNYIINNESIPLFFKIYSGLLKINVIDGGSSYNIGDSVIVRGTSEIPAIAVIDDVVSGTIDGLSVSANGAGYRVGNEIFAETFDPSFFTAQIFTVNDSGINSTNTITFYSDVISDYENVSINSVDYGFPNSGTENVNSVISQALTSNVIVGFGPVTSANVLISQISSSLNPTFTTESTQLLDNLKVEDLGCIGKINIINGGENYEVGDQLLFTNVNSFAGQGANGIVSLVDENGSITGVYISDPGLSYQYGYFPEITVNSSNGSNAVLEVSELMGFGATYTPIIEEGFPGQIKSIKIVSEGVGYEIVPGIDLTFSGDGNAIANSELTEAFTVTKGKWKSSDGILSDDEIRLQGRDYFIPYSYVISSQIEFKNYKDFFKKLIHPAGLINYAKYRIFENINVNTSSNVVSSLIKTVSGTANITNNSNTVVGTNTEFSIASSLGILSEGNLIVIDNQIRTVISIDDSETLTVNNVFNTTSNNELIKILS
jgi:hypothetical protein